MRIQNNIILTVLFFGLTSLSQVVFYTYHESLTLNLPFEKFMGLLIILFIFSFIRRPIWRFIAMGFILILSFFQMVHLQYYGLPVYPSEIYLLFSEFGEVVGTLKESMGIFLLPILLTVPSLIILWYCNKNFPSKISNRFLHYFFIFYLVYNPIRTYMTGNTWGRQPSTQELDGMNIYLSISYFLGKILPNKLTKKELSNQVNHSVKLEQEKDKLKPRNIIVILGESLSSNHLSLMGYRRKTTPFLDSLKDNKNFIYRRGISSGVSTDISVAFFMNNTFGINGNRSVFSGENCLFNLAKKSNFKTYFYSTQSQEQLRYITNSICPKYIDHYKSLEDIDPNLSDANAVNDHKLFPLLENIDFEKGNQFIILHQRGSHSPYNLRFTKDSDIFYGKMGTSKDDSVNHYDNSIYHNDLFFKELISMVDTLKVPTSVFIVSDHGEGMGENGVWGHGMLKKEAFEIPVLYYTNSDEEIKSYAKSLQKNPTHLNISLLISKALGFNANIDLTKTPDHYQILGNDMDGFAGFLNLEFSNGKLKSMQRKDI